MEMKEKIYSITNTEFQVFLVLCGIEKFYGIFVMEQKMEDKILLKTLHNMVKKGMLICKDETLQIKEPYLEMFEIIKEATQSFFVEKRQGKYSRNGFGYFYEGILWIEPAMHKKGAYELQIFSVEEWMDYLLEEEYVPNYKTELSEELLQKLIEKPKKEDWTLKENRNNKHLQNFRIETKGKAESEDVKRDADYISIKTKIVFRNLDEKTEQKWIGVYEWSGVEWLVENNRYEKSIPYKKAVWKEWMLKCI